MVKISKNKGILSFRKTFFIIFLLLLVPLFGFICNAAIADDYAPIFYFEGEETCFPVEVEYHLDNSDLKSSDIGGKTINYLDNRLGTGNDGGIIADYQSQESNLGYTVYYYEYDDGDNKVIQYWIFYAFNPGEHNQHEGDWEMVEVVIPVSGLKWVGYSQHYSGQRATWNQVEKEGDHIKVYVSRGSHANYLRSFSGKLGIASDVVGANGKILKPNDYTLVDITTTSWYTEEVLWGELYNPGYLTIGSDGTPTPMFRTDMYGNYMWSGVTWGNNLPQANDMVFILELFMYHFMTIFIILAIVILIVIIVRIYTINKKYGLGPRIASLLYIDGFNLYTIGNVLCILGLILAIVGIYSQWYVVSADIISNVIPGGGGTFDLLVIDGSGINMYMLEPTGTTPLGTVIFPFAAILIIGVILMLLSTFGVHKSKKLGTKYIFRGIRFIVVIVILIVAIIAIGTFSGVTGDTTSDSAIFISNMLDSISSNPIGGQLSDTITQNTFSANVQIYWGFGNGAIILLVAGIIMIIAGILEVVANKIFFEPKITEEEKKTVMPPPALASKKKNPKEKKGIKR
jgi:hypothetical protein